MSTPSGQGIKKARTITHKEIPVEEKVILEGPVLFQYRSLLFIVGSLSRLDAARAG